RHFFGNGFVVLNSDVFFHPQLLTDLLTARYEDAILVSYRNGTKYGNEAMKVKMNGGRLLDISKTMDPDDADGANRGIEKFGKAGAVVLLKGMDALVETGGVGGWGGREVVS